MVSMMRNSLTPSRCRRRVVSQKGKLVDVDLRAGIAYSDVMVGSESREREKGGDGFEGQKGGGGFEGQGGGDGV